MENQGKIEFKFAIRILGALVGSVGFVLLAYKFSILGTALVGVGSLLVAMGE